MGGILPGDFSRIDRLAGNLAAGPCPTSNRSIGHDPSKYRDLASKYVARLSPGEPLSITGVFVGYFFRLSSARRGKHAVQQQVVRDLDSARQEQRGAQ